ncbi:MAG: hypothetical protein L6N96_03535 [Candidatus Methylarchaceae archaeon HK02M2]|nr:hypothetical protein [Candidatus Methylarchaceae archaeon HK02M2]
MDNEKSAITKIQAVLIIALLVISILSVSIFWWYMQPKAFSTVSGIVHLDEPIIGAKISIYDMDDVKIFEENGTYKTGSFTIEVPWGIGQWGGSIPDEFKIVATEGTLKNETFTGTVVRIVQDYNEEETWAFYELNAITTLIAAYLDENPEEDYAKAERDVKRYLEVPTGFDMSEVIGHSRYYNGIFDHVDFMSQARDWGGLNAFVEDCLDEIERGDTHAFIDIEPGKPALIPEGIAFFKFIADGLAKGALEHASGEGMGFIMRLMGFGGEGNIDELSSKMSEVLSEISDIKKDIEDIKNQLKELKELLETIEKELEQYIASLTGLKVKTTIEESYAQLEQYSKQKNVTKADLEKLRDTILDTSNGVVWCMGMLHKLIKGHEDGFGKGLLELYVETAINFKYECQKDYNSMDTYLKEKLEEFTLRYQAFENYFAQLLFLELQGLNLIVEAYLYNNYSTIATNYIENTFQTRIEEQVEVFLDCVAYLVFNAHPAPFLEFANSGELPELDKEPYKSASPYVAKIFPRADYFADKAIRGTGTFTARVVLCTIGLDGDKYPGQYNIPIKKSRIPDPKELILLFRNPDIPFLFWLEGELKQTTLEERAPSQWSMPSTVYDVGSGPTEGKLIKEGWTGTIYWIYYNQIVKIFDEFPEGVYRLEKVHNALKDDNFRDIRADYICQGTGWVSDLNHRHYMVKKYTSLSATISWESNDVNIIYAWEDPKGRLLVGTIVPGGWRLDFGITLSLGNVDPNDEYGFSHSDFPIVVSLDDDGYPYGYWGGYWRTDSGW